MAKESLLPKFEPMTLSQFFKKIGQDFSNLPPVTTAPVPTRTQNLPMGAGSYQTPSGQPNMSIAPNQSVAPKPINVPLKDVASGKAPVVQPKISTPSGGAPAPTKTTIPPAWINPETGGFYTPEEIANNIAKSAPGARAGDVPKFAGDTLTQGPQTTEKLMMDAATLNNARNDIRVGETDPYKVGSESGIAYTPAELAAVEKAYAGIYDPAINSALAKLEAKQKEDEEKRSLDADLKKMAVQFEYDKRLKSIGSGGGGSGTGSNQMTDNERAAQSLFQSNPIVKDYNTVVNQKNSIDAIIKNGVGGPADVSAIFTFMKALDPNSVVRESEFDKAAKSGNLFQGIYSKFNGYFKDKGGFLPANVQDEFQNLINQKLAAQAMSYNNLANQTREIVRRQGMNPDNVVIDFSLAVPTTTAPAASEAEWLNKPDYDNDIKFAREAIANGADRNAVLQRLLKKYKEVNL